MDPSELEEAEAPETSASRVCVCFSSRPVRPKRRAKISSCVSRRYSRHFSKAVFVSKLTRMLVIAFLFIKSRCIRLCMQFKQTQALKTFVNTSEIQFHRDTFANTAMQTYINARMHKVASDLMSERIFSSVSGEASINLEGASRAITLPKDLKEFLLRQGWKNSKVYLVYDDKKKCLIVYSKERLNEIIKQRLGISEKIARKK